MDDVCSMAAFTNVCCRTLNLWALVLTRVGKNVVIFSGSALITLYWSALRFVFFWPAEGVEVYPGTLVSKAKCEEGRVKIVTEDGKEVCVCWGIACVG